MAFDFFLPLTRRASKVDLAAEIAHRDLRPLPVSLSESVHSPHRKRLRRRRTNPNGGGRTGASGAEEGALSEKRTTTYDDGGRLRTKLLTEI